jgi:hypothetical protein
MDFPAKDFPSESMSMPLTFIIVPPLALSKSGAVEVENFLSAGNTSSRMI